ncbi:hypothetical protein IM793_16615 [Pedobacter sp. MR2016-19]|uniref:YncE family protein n=1 Tax=Pedobacter sp. MR2016-19 TaxID=2780089 RepID=UPI0018747CEE|nr:hypothetical protein [Pedobacter sp. MR2016-19]MBE5320794.1 hypothetical protein [Pedobacter sp. MR2016-19]
MATKFTANYFTVLNKNGQNNLYRTDDIDFNELTFSCINRSQAAITFKGGENPSSLEFSMPFLRDGDIDPVKDFKFDNIDGWEPVLLLNKKWAVWKFVCKNDIELLPGKSFSFVIKKILCKTYDGGYFFVKTIAVPGYADLEPALGKGLTVIAPESSKLSLPLGVSYTDLVYPINTQTDRPHAKVSLLKDSQYEGATLPIYLTYDPLSQIKNGFKLLFTTDTDIEIFKPGGEIKEASITIMFLFGTYPHQITTTDLGNSIEINANQVGWKLRRNADSPSWKWIADPQTIREFTSFSFNIRRLVTDMDAVEGISLMYVQVNNFGKFADHVFRFQLIKKVATPSILNFNRNNASITIGENVGLSWATSLANKMEIAYKSRDNERIILSTIPKPGEHQIELTQYEPLLLPVPPTAATTTFEATAYGPGNSKASTSITIDVKQRVAEIQSFIATPAIIVKGVKTTVTLSWSVRDASQLKLYIGDQEIDVKNSTSKQVELDGPFEYKLVARSYGDELPNVTKTLKVCQYENRKVISLPFNADKKGDRPRVVQCKDKSLDYIFLHTGQDELYSICLSINLFIVKTKTNFNSFAVLWEKRLLAYYNIGDGDRHGIYVKSILNDQWLGDFTPFPDAADHPMPMRLSPDGKKLYVSFKQAETYRATYLNSEDPKNLRIETGYQPIYGTGAPFIGFNIGNSSVLYVPNNEDLSLLTSTYTRDGRIEFTKTQLSGKVIVMVEPAIGTKEQKTYLAYENSNLISVIPPDLIPYQIDIGAQPFDMTLSADEQTLYVACIKENKVLAINTKNRQVETVYSSVDTPSCLKLSPDGLLLFVGNHRARTLTVINVKNDNISAPIPLGEQAGNPITISVIQMPKDYYVVIGKENYSQRTKWTDTIIIKPNTSLNVNMFNFYKPG